MFIKILIYKRTENKITIILYFNHHTSLKLLHQKSFFICNKKRIKITNHSKFFDSSAWKNIKATLRQAHVNRHVVLISWLNFSVKTSDTLIYSINQHQICHSFVFFDNFFKILIIFFFVRKIVLLSHLQGHLLFRLNF